MIILNRCGEDMRQRACRNQVNGIMAKWPVARSREELHKLIASMPDTAIDIVHGILSRMQSWPPPEIEEMRKRTDDARQGRMQELRPLRMGTVSFSTRSGRYDPNKNSGSSSQSYWDGDTAVTETTRRYKGYEINMTERLRIEGLHLFYKHEVIGPDNKRDEHEIVFDIHQR